MTIAQVCLQENGRTSVSSTSKDYYWLNDWWIVKDRLICQNKECVCFVSARKMIDFLIWLISDWLVGCLGPICLHKQGQSSVLYQQGRWRNRYCMFQCYCYFYFYVIWDEKSADIEDISQKCANGTYFLVKNAPLIKQSPPRFFSNIYWFIQWCNWFKYIESNICIICST